VDVTAASPDNRSRLFLAGLAINLGNPKVIVFFLALLPTVIDLRALTPFGFAELASIVAIIASSVLTAYALAAGRARRLFTSPRAVRAVNRGSSAVMAGAAVTIVAH
jgi:threonine/homoserine/homoserine lactone efflux protein